MEERLQKLMAHAGVASRRACEKMIEAGQVKVNGRVARLGDKADPDTDTIEVNGRPLTLKQADYVYIALHKPKGVLSSLEDELEKGRRTVRDLVPLPGHLYPVGRLDKQSEGLMLMTNDGDLAHKLTHPRYGHKKMYQVTVEGRIAPETLETWRQGVYLDGSKTIPAEISVIRQEASYSLLQIVMREGRKRQIRRLANMLGHPVMKLVRVQIGPIQLGSLKKGEWRHLRPAEVAQLQESLAAHKPKPPRRRPKPGGRKRKPPLRRGKSGGPKPPPKRKA